ncbi:MAG: asparagine synthase-related protein [Candidatus Competibacteraceae bacterium]
MVQSGQGADEAFGGYFWYPLMDAEAGSDLERFRRLLLRPGPRRISANRSLGLSRTRLHRLHGRRAAVFAGCRRIFGSGIALRRHHLDCGRSGQTGG